MKTLNIANKRIGVRRLGNKSMRWISVVQLEEANYSSANRSRITMKCSETIVEIRTEAWRREAAIEIRGLHKNKL